MLKTVSTKATAWDSCCFGLFNARKNLGALLVFFEKAFLSKIQLEPIGFVILNSLYAIIALMIEG